MNAPDWTVIERMRSAQIVSDLCNEAEIMEREAAEQDVKTNRVLDAIRKCDLTPATVRQILCTLACEMTRAGFHPVAVAGVEDAADL